ncbi:MAG: hypothetical protein HC905_07220 [Bacteroidales bacterium]|nr:hypothetical protein [Bacteroidales bacterium]
MEITKILEKKLIPDQSNERDMKNWSHFLQENKKLKVILQKVDKWPLFSIFCGMENFQNQSIIIRAEQIPNKNLNAKLKMRHFSMKAVKVEVLCELNLADTKPYFIRNIIENMDNSNEMEQLESQFHASFEKRQGINRFLKPKSLLAIAQAARSMNQIRLK